MVTLSKIKWVLNNKIESHLQKGEITAFVLESNGSGLIYRHLDDKVVDDRGVATIIKFSNEDELNKILENLMRNKTEYKDGTIQELKTRYQNRAKKQGPSITNGPKSSNFSNSDIRLGFRTRHNSPFDSN